ncbi:MAG: phosphoenolpyruvate carboxykinase [Bacteroidetes bacterium]|uniref:Phosphoenolpyruvate carboxykinase n=1 Tax=Candidatus Cryptobacteroides intestinigallinarum TaxID=2840767 RepID=A0A9D9MZM8_9BACT|nr:phosphoenolpyruvate carboxykinase [Candidatus Cryptobacteroides intestinigallinarum]
MKDRTYTYRIAGFCLSLSLPDRYDPDAMLPSFRRFKAADDGGCHHILDACMTEEKDRRQEDSCSRMAMDEISDEMGYSALYRTADGYLVRLRPHNGSCVHTMYASEDFSDVKIVLSIESRYAASALCSMLRIAFSQSIIRHQAVAVHASAVAVRTGRDLYSYLFMGKSGAGKSTHSSLWLKNIAGSFLLNDDNPVLRIEDNLVMAYGTPWSGKTPCYRNMGCPVKGIAGIRRADRNIFVPLDGAAAFSMLLRGSSAIRRDRHLFSPLCDTLACISEKVGIGLMECLPDAEAATICRSALESAVPCGMQQISES